MARPAALLSLGVMALAAWAVGQALGWPWKAALFPLVIGIPIFFLAAGELCLSVWGSRTPASGQAVDFVLSTGVEPAVARRRTLAAFAWIGGLFVAIVGLGFPVAVPVFVLLYLRLQGGEGWLRAVILAAAAWGFVYGLFVRLLNLPFAEGWVQAWLRVVGGPT